MFCSDTQYFFWHLVHHKNPHLYIWVHAIHHDYISPFSWSTQHLSAVELMTVGFWNNFDPIVLKCRTIWTSDSMDSLCFLHLDVCGRPYRLQPALFPRTPGYFGLLEVAMAHDIHHQRPSSNFAPFFSHWDRLFGTAVTVKPTKKTDKEK